MSSGADGTAGILIEEVVHSYRGRDRSLTVLDGISLSIRRGAFVALVGPSGCGKTTLLDILSGLVELQRGRVTVGRMPPAVGRSDTARMFARDALLPWRTAYANVDFAMATRNPDRDRRRTVIHELLDDVGLNGFENAYPRQLSQGMRQRVALARTFSLESDFVFLDEPFGALDAQTKLVLQDKLLRLWEKMQSTVVLVSHDLAEAVALADRVVVMSARPGRIAADIAIDLPRPRSVSALQSMSDYHELYSRLWRELERATGPVMGPEMASSADNAALEDAVQHDADRQRRHRLFVLWGRLVLLLVVVGIWEALAWTGLVPAAFIGRPSKFLPLLVEETLSGKFAVAAVDTLSATLMAFVLGGILALLTALALAVYPTLKELVDPYIDALNALPRVALVPLFIVWFGLGTLSKVVSGVSLMYFILLYNTLAGAQSVDPDHLQLSRSLGLRRRQVFLRVVIPTAIPSIFVGLRLGLVYTLLGVVTAELIAGGKGLGSLISYYSNTFDADGVFAVLLVLVVLADALSMIMTRIEQWLTRWNR